MAVTIVSEERIAQAIRRVHETGQIAMPDGSVRKLTCHIDAAEGALLTDLVVQAKAKNTVEIGMGTGLSGLHICQGLARLGGGQHLAIDPFQKGEFWGGAGLALRDSAGCADMFEWSGKRDDQLLPRLVEDGRRFEFALIDGDHRFETAMLDFYYLDKMLTVGGICAIDDADWPSVWRVIRFAQRHRYYEWVSAVEVDQGPWTRPWGWKLKSRRWGLFRRQGWSVWEAMKRKPYSLVALRKVRENDRPEYFWASLEE